LLLIWTCVNDIFCNGVAVEHFLIYVSILVDSFAGFKAVDQLDDTRTVERIAFYVKVELAI
jgi:hypothetical protein